MNDAAWCNTHSDTHNWAKATALSCVKNATATWKCPRPHPTPPFPPPSHRFQLPGWFKAQPCQRCSSEAAFFLYSPFLFFEKSCQRLTLLTPHSSLLLLLTSSPPLPFLPLPAWGHLRSATVYSFSFSTWHRKPLLHLPVFEPRHLWNVHFCIRSVGLVLNDHRMVILVSFGLSKVFFCPWEKQHVCRFS